MKKTVFIVLFLQSIFMWAQITLPIQQSNIPKNHLVVNYDFSKNTSYSGIGAAVTNLSNSLASDNATLVNTPSFSSSFGYIYLNGYNHYLLSPNLKPYFKSVTATNLQDSHTLSLWICPVASSGVIVNELGSADINSGFRDSQIEMVNGYVKFRVYPAGESDRITSLSTIALNQWHHIAMVYDGATAKGYVDGVLQDSKTYARTNPINNNTNLHYSIGAPCVTHMGSGAAGNFFLAQFKMYNIPLTGADIMQEFTKEIPNFQNKWIPTSTDVFSPATNSNPTYWSVSSSWVNDGFNGGVNYPHYSPWLNSYLGWAAQVNNLNQYIILNYHRPTTIAGIVTQGRANNGGQWVSKAHVEVSLDGSTWTRVLTDVVLNYDALNTVTVLFPTTVYAKYVKVIPTDWGYHITMRLGIIVKPAPIITNGLVLQLDAADLNSYSGTGTTWTDISGSSNNATLINGPVFNSSNGGHFIFDGVNDVVTGTTIPSTSGNNSRTVIAWYKSTSNQNTSILDKGDFGTINTAEQFFIVAQNGVGDLNAATTIPPSNIGGVYVAFWGNDIFYPIPAATIFDGNWHCVAYTYDSSNSSVKIFFDGVFASTIYLWNGSWNTLNSSPYRLQSSINTTNNPYWIGGARAKMWGKGSEFGNSRIAAVSIYNRSLTEQEILTNFNALKSRYGM